MLPAWAAVVQSQLQAAGLHPATDPVHARLEHLWLSQLAPNSVSSYNSKLTKYLTFCTEQRMAPFPASSLQMQLYIAYLSLQGIAPSSFAQYVSAVMTAHRHMLLPTPCIEMISGLVRAAGRSAVAAGELTAARGPLPARVAAKALALAVAPGTSPTLLLQCTALLLAFHSGLRGASVMALTCADLILYPATRTYALSVWDEKGRAHLGQRRLIPGSCDYPQLYILLHHVRGAISSAPSGDSTKLFAALGSATDAQFGAIVAAVLAALNEDPPAGEKWLGHSCRAGMASACSAVGVSFPRLLERGGWHSNAVLQYIFHNIIEDAFCVAFFGFLLPHSQHAAARQAHVLPPLASLLAA